MNDLVAEKMPTGEKSNFQKISQALTALTITYQDYDRQERVLKPMTVNDEQYLQRLDDDSLYRKDVLIKPQEVVLDKETVLSLLRTYQARLWQEKAQGEEKEPLPLAQCERAIELMISGRMPHNQPNPESLLYTITNISAEIKSDVRNQAFDHLVRSKIKEKDSRTMLAGKLDNLVAAKNKLTDNLVTFVADHAVEWTKGPQLVKSA